MIKINEIMDTTLWRGGVTKYIKKYQKNIKKYLKNIYKISIKYLKYIEAKYLDPRVCSDRRSV